MANLPGTFHGFLVENAKFPFPVPLIGGSVTSTDIDGIEVGRLERPWKAMHAVPDNNLAVKLCNTLRDIFGETPLTEDSRNSLLPLFLPALTADADRKWLTNRDEAKVSIILVPREFTSRLWGQSKRLLDFGVFEATRKCLRLFDQSSFFQVEAEQKIVGAGSIVDFHALVNDDIVAIVEAKSPKVMHKLGELLPQNAIEMKWMAGSTNLLFKIFSKVGV